MTVSKLLPSKEILNMSTRGYEGYAAIKETWYRNAKKLKHSMKSFTVESYKKYA